MDESEKLRNKRCEAADREGGDTQGKAGDREDDERELTPRERRCGERYPFILLLFCSNNLMLVNAAILIMFRFT